MLVGQLLLRWNTIAAAEAALSNVVQDVVVKPFVQEVALRIHDCVELVLRHLNTSNAEPIRLSGGCPGTSPIS
jgi:hypothetical protein